MLAHLLIPARDAWTAALVHRLQGDDSMIARRRRHIFFTIFLSALAPRSAGAATLTTQAGDASIVHDEAAGEWILSAGGTSLTLALGAARDFAVVRLVTTTGMSWIGSATADSLVTVGAKTVALGNRAAGFGLREAWVESSGGRLQLNAAFELAGAGLRVVRHYAVVSGSPTFEAWSTYEPLGGTPPVVSDLSALQLVLPAGTIRSLTGLQGDNASVEGGSVFTLQERTLGTGGRFAIGATGRASESAVPWMAIDGARDEFYVALMWSGAWTLAAERTGRNLALTVGLGPMTTTVRAAVDGPHVVFGAVPGGIARATAALRTYVLDGIRAGRPIEPLVTYNTWFAYGTEIDEATLIAEMERAAALGAELFVVDAGWYAGAGAAGPYDFDSGLGSWTPGPNRFADGLRPLRDRAHALGMKFGIWVEPERVSLALVGHPGAEEAWLATTGGAYGSDHAAQICLSSAAARRWILGWLAPLLDDVQPDYLKWDNNMWINCDRAGHDHGPADGNFAHVNGLYQIFETLRAQYPDLLIENVSGGGNRLDLGMLRYTDAAWMDDRTAPSVHVRHNIEGLSAVFPPAYLLSFVTDHEGEPLRDSPDLPLYMRSRMTGVLGLCFRSAELSAEDAVNLQKEIALYKRLRDTLSAASGSLLTAQADADDGPAWDVLQMTADGDQAALLWAYQWDDGVTTINVKPVGLAAGERYGVESVDSGMLGTATGGDLMTRGIDIVANPGTAAHVLIIRSSGTPSSRQ